MTARKAGLFMVVAVAALVTGCASTGPTSGERSRMDLLTRQEILDTGATNLYDVIQRLRPRWLAIRSARSFSMETEIVVLQNDMLLGNLEALKQLSPELAFEIEYMDGAKAIATLPGLMSGRHVEAAIIVKTRPHGGG